MSSFEPHPAGDVAVCEKSSQSFFRNKFMGKKKLTLTPELQQSPSNTTKTQCTYSDSKFISLNGLEYLKNKAVSLCENVELISENILIERKNYQDFVDGLQRQVVQLEDEVRAKTACIEDLQLYHSDKAKIVESLVAVLEETRWKRDEMRLICEEHSQKPRDDIYKTVLLVDVAADRVAAFESQRDSLLSCVADLPESGNRVGTASVQAALQKLCAGLDECAGVTEKVADRGDRMLSDSLLNDHGLCDAVKRVIRATRDFRLDVSLRSTSDLDSAPDVEAVVESLEIAADRDPTAGPLWAAAKELFLYNRRLANRVISVNVHKTGLQLELEEMENDVKELELVTKTEIEQVEKKQEMLNHNESLIQQNWDELDTSLEIVAQTQKAQEIDQELEDLQIEYDTYNEENRQLKKILDDKKNELIDYQMKCEQLEKDIKCIENDKNDILEAYAKSWGHHNAKQKIKYTGRLIKDIDSVTQEIKSLELEIEKQENSVVDYNVKTPVFGKTQPKSENVPKTFGIINSNKRNNTTVFRESVVRNLRY